MKKRYTYSLLFGIPGFFVSLIVSFFIFGVVTGILWIFVFGDQTWPASLEKILPIWLLFIFLGLWITSVALGFRTGKKLEDDPQLDTKHIAISAGVTIAQVVLIILYQLSIGNIGPKADDVLCSEFCSKKGYSGSGMPPRNSGERSCSCFDDTGREILKVPIDSIVLR
jgi:hypothetical protein